MSERCGTPNVRGGLSKSEACGGKPKWLSFLMTTFCVLWTLCTDSVVVGNFAQNGDQTGSCARDAKKKFYLGRTLQFLCRQV